MTKPVVVITGATGRLGRSVCDAFRHAGYHVAAVTRQTTACLEADEVLTASDLEHISAPTLRPSAVVHLAAETVDEANMFAVNVKGSEAILDWAIRHRAGQFIYMSSVGVYGPKCRGVVTPAKERRPRNTYERTKTVAEELVLRMGSSGALPVTVLQPSNVFGMGPQWSMPLLGLMRSISRGRFRYVGRQQTQFNYVEVRDVARACVEALRPEAHGRTFILNDPVPLSRVVEIVADAAGVEQPRRRLPYALALPAAATLTGLALVSRQAVPLDLGRLRALTSRTTYDGSDIEAVLGFRYSLGTERGIRELAHHYRNLSLL
jgi:nucleoside-diphosphate-sugar epimerase